MFPFLAAGMCAFAVIVGAVLFGPPAAIVWLLGQAGVASNGVVMVVIGAGWVLLLYRVLERDQVEPWWDAAIGHWRQDRR